MFDTVRETLALNDLLTRFFQAFDDKNWHLMRRCLDDHVFTDYFSFRGEPASIVSADHYVEQRRMALHALDTQHNFLNLRVEIDTAAGTATGRCNYIVHRFPSRDGRDGHYFHSYGHYRFAFAHVGGAWLIAGIVQRLLRSEGNRELHGALRTGDGSS
jgi:hypothetical protein